MPQVTLTRSSQVRRRRLIGIIYLAEVRPFTVFLPVVTMGESSRNPQSNQIQFVWTFSVFYRMPCDRTWRGDQVSCDWCSKCSKVKIPWAKFTAAFWFNLGFSRIVRCMTSYLLGFDSRAVLLRDLRDLLIFSNSKLDASRFQSLPPFSIDQYWWVQTSCSQWGQR